jgi:hypothetical protein
LESLENVALIVCDEEPRFRVQGVNRSAGRALVRFNR